MTLLSSFIVAFSSLRANALRSFLAMLGVIIGVAAVVTMVAISTGAQKQVEDQISSLGTNVLMLRPGSRSRGGRSGGAATSFSEKDINALLQAVPDIEAAAGEISTRTQIVAGNKNWAGSIEGVTNDYFLVREWTIGEGRDFIASELRGGKVAILGSMTAKELFGESDAIGERIRIKSVPFTIIGVMKEKGGSGWGGRSTDDIIFVPLKTARMRLMGRDDVVRDYVRAIDVKARDGSDVTYVEEQINTVMRGIREIAPGAADDFRIFNMAEFLQTRNATTSTFTTLLAGTAAVALIVGGIGIMNIMLVSVTERTREIGLRMAIGARQRDIMVQFLIEAVALTIVGGIIGIMVGAAGTTVAADLGQWNPTINLDIVLLALGFSTFVGVFFGFWPAWKASKLNPIDALRFD